MRFPHLPVTNNQGVTQNFEHLQQLLTKGVARGTSLPANPIDGQEYDYETNGVIWRFRYQAGSGSSHKWNNVGGPAVSKGPGGEAKLTVVSEVALTGGPEIVVPLPGEYYIAAGAQIILEEAVTVETQLAVRKNGTVLTTPMIYTISTAFNRILAMGVPLLFEFAKGDVLTLAAKTIQNGKVTVVNGTLRLEPIRVG